MRRRIGIALLLLLGLGMVLAWVFAPKLVRSLVFTAPSAEQQTPTLLADVTALQDQVASAMSSLGLQEDLRHEHSEQPLEDTHGRWLSVHETWHLSSDTDALSLAQRLEALVASSDQAAEIYLLEQQNHLVQVRFYAGSRLALVLELKPSLGPWPTLVSGQSPLLALVIHGVDKDPHGVRQLMEQGEPMALALSPYSPFTLRLSRDALLTHTEVLALAEADVTLAESLEAVPHASGLLITSPPVGDAEQQAQALRHADVYVLDALEQGLGANWLRALQEAEVPYQRATCPQSDLGQRRYRHSAARDGASVVAVPAARGAEEAAALRAAAERGYRLAFPSEVVEAARR